MPTQQVPLAGEIITWKAGGSIAYDALVRALNDQGFSESLARPLQPRYAFSRAASDLSEQRIIKKLREEDDILVFQLNRVEVSDDEISYPLETTLELNKTSGEIECPVADLEQQARLAFDQAMTTRRAGDITKIVKRIFDAEGDLFAIRDDGHAYFVPIAHQTLVERVQAFLQQLGGGIRRFPVPQATVEGDLAMQETVADGIQQMIDRVNAAIEELDDTSRDSTLQRRAERINSIRARVREYAELLGGESERLRQALRRSEEALGEREAGIRRRRIISVRNAAAS